MHGCLETAASARGILEEQVCHHPPIQQVLARLALLGDGQIRLGCQQHGLELGSRHALDLEKVSVHGPER